MGVKVNINVSEVAKAIQNATEDAMKEIALLIEKEMILLVPVHSGDLRKSIDHDSEKDYARIGVLKSSKGDDYAVFVEKGTRYQTAQPYVKPAFQNMSDKEILNILKKYYKKELS